MISYFDKINNESNSKIYDYIYMHDLKNVTNIIVDY